VQYKPTESLDAYAIYYGGWLSFNQYGNRLATAEALRLFNSAIELDPEFALAYSPACHRLCPGQKPKHAGLQGTAVRAC